jgi:hypothetical protein
LKTEGQAIDMEHFNEAGVMSVNLVMPELLAPDRHHAPIPFGLHRYRKQRIASVGSR